MAPRIHPYITLSLTSALCAAMPAWGQSSESTEPKKQADVVELEKVDVYGTADDSGRSGFRPKQAQVGPFNRRSLQDTPLSINVLDQRLIENQQASSLTELLRFLPSAQMEARGGPDVGRPQTRGLQGDPVANSHLDGMNSVATTAQPIEMIERLEVINGLGGAFYGPASPAGYFNFILKRPTDDFFNKFTVGYTNSSTWKAHADLGGRVGDGKFFGYRINVLTEDGEGYVDHSDTERRLASGAFDFRLGRNTVLEVNGSYYKFEKFGFPGGFAYGTAITLPDAPDPTRVGYGQSYTGMSLETRTGSARLRHEFNADWNLTVGVLTQTADRWLPTVSNTLTDNAGSYTSRVSSSVAGRFEVSSHTVNLNGHFSTGGVQHDFVVGSTGYDWDIYAARSSQSYTLGTASIGNPVRFSAVPLSDSGARYQSTSNNQKNIMVGDVMTFSPRWSAMLAGSYNWLESENYNQAGARTGRYKDNGFSPTVSLMFKPLGNVTTYVSYAESLQQGATAPTTGVANPGQTLAPYRSEQWEVGVKADLGPIDANLALFEIERPFPFVDPADNVYKEAGNQVNRGVELSVGGEVWQGLNLFGGVTLLDPKLKDTGNPLTSDTYVVGVPKVQANLLMEYFVQSVAGLAVNANVHRTGSRKANNQNTSSVDGYTTLDLGVRYDTRVFGTKKATFRLGVKNVFDEHYWLSIFPGDINGGTSSNTAFLGSPREVSVSASIEF